MEQSANAEKQARYRKKEKLKRKADQLLRKWQLEPYFHKKNSIQEVHHLIDAAINLPAGWTDQDYINAEHKLEHVSTELTWPINQISTDIRESRNVSGDSIKPQDLPRINTELTNAEEKTNALASHIISALKLSGCNEADQAAALMEAMRFVGRALTGDSGTPCSPATAMCLSTINPIYSRPKWFSEKLATTLSSQIHPEQIQVIVKYLSQKNK